MSSNIEIERRWLLPSFPQAVIDAHAARVGCHSIEIEQGYLQDGLRVRITTTADGTMSECELTKKTGKGIKRTETNEPISLDAAVMLIDSTRLYICKTRYKLDGWEVDAFHDKLDGLTLLERELTSTDEEVTLPHWAAGAVEVTDTLNNRQLAQTARLLSSMRPDGTFDLGLITAPKQSDARRIVLTGGPCGGKSTLVDELKKDGGFLCVPEVATMVMSNVGITPEVGEFAFQRMLYGVQASLEAAAISQAQKLDKHTVVFDRGTLDSAAFMIEGVKGFERVCETSQASEFARYDAVIQLAVPDRATYDQHRASNPVRRETWLQAMDVEMKLNQVWQTHPGYVMVREDAWHKKLGLAFNAVESAVVHR